MDEESTVVSEVVEQPTTQTESATVENTEVASDTAEVTEAEESQVEVENTAETEATETTEAEDTEAQPIETKGKGAQERIRHLANENRQLREYAAQLEALKANTEEDYINAGYEQERAEFLAFKESVEQDKAINAVVQLNSSIDNDVNSILRDFPEFNPKSDKFIGEAEAKEVAAMYDEWADVQYDPQGKIAVSAKALPYDFYKRQATLIRNSQAKAGVKAQASAEKMMASVEPQTSAAPPAGNDDSIEAMRERLSTIKF